MPSSCSSRPTVAVCPLLAAVHSEVRPCRQALPRQLTTRCNKRGRHKPHSHTPPCLRKRTLQSGLAQFTSAPPRSSRSIAASSPPSAACHSSAITPGSASWQAGISSGSPLTSQTAPDACNKRCSQSAAFLPCPALLAVLPSCSDETAGLLPHPHTHPPPACPDVHRRQRRQATQLVHFLVVVDSFDTVQSFAAASPLFCESAVLQAEYAR